MREDHGEGGGRSPTGVGQAEPGPWSIGSIDTRGLDLAAGEKVRRVNFAAPLTSAAEIRPGLVQMAKEAREKLAG